MATPTHAAGQVTVTVTPTAVAGADPEQTTSSTLSLIYIYSASTTAEPTAAASSTTDSGSSIGGGAIAGIVVGSVAFLVILALALFCYSRNVARKRRAEMASLHPSAPTATSRAHSRATTAVGQGGTEMTGTGGGNSQYARSMGARSAATATPADSRSVARVKSPENDFLPSIPPQELPTPHNRPELEASRGSARVVYQKKRQPKPGVSEVYGSHVYPVELQADSTTSLMGAVQQVKTSSGSSGRGRDRDRDRDDRETGSDGYLSPTPGWRPGPGTSEAGIVSDMDGTTDAGDDESEKDFDNMTAEERSIYIYYRPGSLWDPGSSPLSKRQSQIITAMTRASSRGKP